MSQTVIVKKAARSFRVGEVLLLNCCDTGDLYGVLRGAFIIREIKHQSDTGVSFFLGPQFPRLHGNTEGGYQPYTQEQRSYLLEFARGQILQRLSGAPVTCLIEEAP
jgi:hypothetical protein